MTIIEAIKSGKRFKRKNDPIGFSKFSDFFMSCGPMNGHFAFRESDLLADDWEIEEKKVEVTRDKFLAIVNRLHSNAADGSFAFSVSDYALKILLKELGLE